jgi:hypothetical protein
MLTDAEHAIPPADNRDGIVCGGDGWIDISTTMT